MAVILVPLAAVVVLLVPLAAVVVLLVPAAVVVLLVHRRNHQVPILAVLMDIHIN